MQRSPELGPGKYFNFTLGQGRNFFGEGHRSLMLSDEAYSYPYLRITTSIWKIKYVNLFTMMNDIRGADGARATCNASTPACTTSWNVSKRLNVALFESIV
ncbi:MAG: gliding motility protein RemB, partial [Flavobacteriales bacterium]|nr:gliding motility protein RemB [Flavobacteriales bacterium]